MEHRLDAMLNSCSMPSSQEDLALFSDGSQPFAGALSDTEHGDSTQIPATEFRVSFRSPPPTPDSPDGQPSPDPFEATIILQNITNSPPHNSDGVNGHPSPLKTIAQVPRVGSGDSISESKKELFNSPTGGKSPLKVTDRVSGLGLRVSDEPGDVAVNRDPSLKYFNEIFGKYKIGSGSHHGSGSDIPVTGKSRKLPTSVGGDASKKVENAVPANLLDVIDTCSAEPDTSIGDLDILEMAKRSGLTFPRPRWWSKDHP